MSQAEAQPKLEATSGHETHVEPSPGEHAGKRKPDDDSRHSAKRANTASRSSEVHIKFLIPSSVAGSIIGRGGDRIAQIQNDANVRVKMSKANDYYPDTNERVCLVIGSIDAVLKAFGLICEKINEKCENQKRNESDLHDRLNLIKLVIPNNTAGFLIGKGGSFVKQIKEDSGAFVQISSKTTDLPERTVTIEGSHDKRFKALDIVVNKIADDPLHNSVPNLNYADFGSQPAPQDFGQQSLPASSNDISSMANYLAGLNNLALLIINCGGAYHMTPDNLKNSLRNAGYSSAASQEIIDALTILLKYGLITKTAPASLLESVQSGAAMPSLANVLSNIVSSISTMASNNQRPSSYNGRASSAKRK
ncbi:RNA-binding Nova-1-like isoform X5 [Brachionus plicatilis]|uniref:RNA-binding Nova-1-like isoform X5 n=1 Tax=Brachionus plicatilis TaxID=10195 RepID=A0A3M7PN68_BRAPC|nr:RNA-binding Nova-1-like isoform X5 [Brachionus plicatilis]